MNLFNQIFAVCAGVKEHMTDHFSTPASVQGASNSFIKNVWFNGCDILVKSIVSSAIIDSPLLPFTALTCRNVYLSKT